MKTNESTFKTFSNKQKVLICRVVLLAPIVCILCVFLVLLICMELIPGQNRTTSDSSNCQTLNCTVQYNANSLDASCIPSTPTNSTKRTNFNCLNFKVWCVLERTDNNTSIPSINGSRGARKSHGNSSWKELGFCLADLTNWGFSQDSLVENGSNFIRETFTNDEAFRNCSFHKTKARTTMTSKCVFDIDTETEQQKRMRKNTSIADAVLATFLSIGLIALFLMCVYTRKTLKVCCHMCYDDEMREPKANCA